MEVRAAVAHQAGKPLVIETVDLAGPRAGDTAEPAKVDPAEINEVIPGYLLIRVLDKDEDRPRHTSEMAGVLTQEF